MNKRSRFGWMELIEGILLLLLGIFSFIRPNGVLTGLVMLYGLAAIITGIADMVFYVKIDRHTGFGPTISLVTGILSVLSGFMFLIYPGAGKVVLTVLFPIWFTMHCISRLSHLNMIRLIAGKRCYYFTMIINIVGLVLGFMTFINPWFTFLSVSYLIGAYLVLSGIDSVITAFSGMGKKW